MLVKWEIYIVVLMLVISEVYVREIPEGSRSTAGHACYADQENHYLYFSSKTAYNAVYNESDYEPPPETCKPKAIWMLMRHGIRYAYRKGFIIFAGLSDIQQRIVYNHRVLKNFGLVKTEFCLQACRSTCAFTNQRYKYNQSVCLAKSNNGGSLCDKDIVNLMKWRWANIPLTETDQLTPEGYSDIVHAGRRLKNKFPELFKKDFSPDLYQFRHTSHLKNKRTAIAFAEGVFGSHKIETNRKEICPYPHDDDLLVRLMPKCKDDLLDFVDDDELLYSKTFFQESQLVKDMVVTISNRLGFSEPLSFKEIENMYSICRYEKAWYQKDLSPWCAIFSSHELKIFEYMNDLAYYYNSGPGLEINKRFGCPLLQDMVNQFQSVIENDDNHTIGKFYFGHSTTLFNLFAYLGTHVDKEHITADNYERMQDRIWKTSLFDPFGSNFDAVFLRCDSGEQHRVMFYLNEKNFEFKECGGKICTWDKFHNIYKDTIGPDVCNTSYCDNFEIDFSKWFEILDKQRNIDSNTTGEVQQVGFDHTGNIDSNETLTQVEDVHNYGTGGEIDAQGLFENETNARYDDSKNSRLGYSADADKTERTDVKKSITDINTDSIDKNRKYFIDKPKADFSTSGKKVTEMYFENRTKFADSYLNTLQHLLIGFGMISVVLFCKVFCCRRRTRYNRLFYVI